MLYAHNDRSHWGEQFAMACGRAGIPCKLFKWAEDVPEGSKAFVRLSQQGEQRQLSKNIIAQLHKRDVLVLPNRIDGELYDDKVKQLAYLKDYLPKTNVWTSKQEAYDALAHMTYPFISKATCGAGSANVCMVNNRVEAEREIEAVFAGGLILSYGNVQTDYLYWQEFVANNDCDYRIIICGKYIFGLIRKNREDKPFASGSGNFSFIEGLENGKERACAELAVEIADRIGSQWIAFDFVFKEDKPLVLEISGSWTTHAYACCPVFNKNDFSRTELNGGHMFDMAVEILNGALL